MRVRSMPPAQPRELGDAEVEHLDDERPVQAVRAEEVRGLEIAVDDPEDVGVGDGLAGLQDEVDLLGDRERPRWRSTPRRSLPSRYSMTI